MGAGHRSEALILDTLNLEQVGGLQIWRVDGCSVINNRRRQHLESKAEVFLGVAPICTSQRFKNLETSGGSVDDRFGMRAKGELGIQSDTQDLWVLVQRNQGSFKKHLGMIIEFMRVGSKECHSRLFRRKRKLLGPIRDRSQHNVHPVLDFSDVQTRFGDREVIGVIHDEFSVFGEVADKEIEEDRRYYAALGNSEVQPTDG